MTGRDRYTAVENEIREQLTRTILVIQPYARSQGHFNDYADLRAAIALAMTTLERAELLANHRLPPTP
jgi:hypothetical protein